MSDIPKSRLVPFDPSRPSVEAMTADGLTLVNREPMRSVLWISIEDLAQLLHLPPNHRIERIDVSGPNMAPALLVMVEGAAMAQHSPSAPPMVEQYRRVMDEIDDRLKWSGEFWLKNAVKPRAFE